MYPTVKNEGSHYLIETFHFTMKVFGLCEHQGQFEGFDSLVIENLVRFDSLDELDEAFFGTEKLRAYFAEIITGLKVAAQEENAAWLSESRNLRQYLGTLRG